MTNSTIQNFGFVKCVQLS